MPKVKMWKTEGLPNDVFDHLPSDERVEVSTLLNDLQSARLPPGLLLEPPFEDPAEYAASLGVLPEHAGFCIKHVRRVVIDKELIVPGWTQAFLIRALTAYAIAMAEGFDPEYGVPFEKYIGIAVRKAYKQAKGYRQPNEYLNDLARKAIANDQRATTILYVVLRAQVRTKVLNKRWFVRGMKADALIDDLCLHVFEAIREYRAILLDGPTHLDFSIVFWKLAGRQLGRLIDQVKKTVMEFPTDPFSPILLHCSGKDRTHPSPLSEMLASEEGERLPAVLARVRSRATPKVLNVLDRIFALVKKGMENMTLRDLAPSSSTAERRALWKRWKKLEQLLAEELKREGLGRRTLRGWTPKRTK